MARVKRFRFNSDFMTVASVGRKEVTLTIPAGETRGGQFTGVVRKAIDIPANSWGRMQIKYTGSIMSVHMATTGYFAISATKSGKNIQYSGDVFFEKGYVGIRYYVINTTDTTTVLTNAQTITLVIDFLQQPNS